MGFRILCLDVIPARAFYHIVKQGRTPSLPENWKIYPGSRPESPALSIFGKVVAGIGPSRAPFLHEEKMGKRIESQHAIEVSDESYEHFRSDARNPGPDRSGRGPGRSQGGRASEATSAWFLRNTVPSMTIATRPPPGARAPFGAGPRPPFPPPRSFDFGRSGVVSDDPSDLDFGVDSGCDIGRKRSRSPVRATAKRSDGSSYPCPSQNIRPPFIKNAQGSPPPGAPGTRNGRSISGLRNLRIRTAAQTIRNGEQGSRRSPDRPGS